jgi:GT2 family glycosyltransferase
LLGRRPDLAPRLAEPTAELVTAAMIEEDVDAVLRDFALDDPWREQWVRPALAAHGPTFDGFAFPWTMAIGGNASMPRALLDRAGLLDEAFVGWGLEDTELCYRLHRAGAEVRALDGGTSDHQVHRRGPERGPEWVQNAQRFLARHGELDVCLYLAVMSHRLTLPAAMALWREHAALAGRAPALTAELIRLYRDMFGGRT